jgi:secreted Zn-dependent insulinase-like peptidase
MLRTKLALGYIAGCSIMTTDKVTGFTVLAQGARLDASRMDEAPNAFVENFGSTLAVMSDADVATYMDALRAQIEQSPLTLASAASAVWMPISTGHYRFDRVAEDVATLNSITKESLLESYRKYLASASFRKISVEVFGEGATIRLPDYATNNTVLLSTDEGEIPAWQAAHDAFPLDE